MVASKSALVSLHIMVMIIQQQQKHLILMVIQPELLLLVRKQIIVEILSLQSELVMGLQAILQNFH